MKHPVRDRILILLSALASLLGAAALVAFVLGRLTLTTRDIVFSDGTLGLPMMAYLRSWQEYGMSLKAKIVLIVIAAVLFIFAALLIGTILPSKKQRSSNYAVQHNENGMVRISLKAIESLVQKCLDQHAEIKVVTSSLYSNEESIRVDVHVMLQTDISMPLAISALQKQIKKYLEACSGVTVQEVRIFVEGTTLATEETAKSPYAIPASLLGMDCEALPNGAMVAEPEHKTPEQTESVSDRIEVSPSAAADETIPHTDEKERVNAEKSMEEGERL